ncbi:MAG: ABC transporter substrate-binding protein [Dehalococcoidia bacterium]
MAPFRSLLAAALLVTTVACAPSAPTTGGVAPPGVSKDFTLKVGVTGGSANLDPQASIGDIQMSGLFEALVAQDDKGKVLPELASAWRNVDASTWTFTLAPGRTFHDGSPVTAQDVKFSFDRAMNPDLKLGTLVRVGTFDKAEIVDPQTIRIVTKGPDPLLLKRVALVAILSKAQVDKPDGTAALGMKPIGTGPFMLKEFVPNDKLILLRNPNHPRPAGPAEVSIRAVPEASARVVGLRTGELDLIQTINIDQATELKNGGFNIVNFNQGQSIGAFLFTTNEGRPTQNKLVRQALNYAINKEQIAKDIYKGLTVATGQVVQTDTFGYNPKIKPYPYDPAKAKQLLAQAGYPNGFRLKMDVTTNVSDAQTIFLFVQSQWREIGLNPEMEVSSDSAFFLDRWYGRVERGDMLTASLVNSPAMDADFALTWFKGTEAMPARRYSNPEFDRAYMASTTEMNEQKRAEYLQKAIEIMYEDPAFLFLVDGVRLWGASSKLANVNARPDLRPDYSIIKLK